MPGIIGFLGNLQDRNPERLLDGMAQAMKDEEWYRIQTYQVENIGLGRISLGITNTGTQPAWNETKTICAAMEGEVYDTQEIKRDLLERGHRFQGIDDVELVLHLYEQVGEQFAIKLNGAFVVAIWDRTQRKLVIATDRLALHPLFYSFRDGFLVFASGVRGLLADPKMPRTVDRVAMAQFLTFQHMLGDRTYLEEVHFLPGASVMIYQDGRLQIQPYWTLRYPESYQFLDEEAYLEPLLSHLRKAVARQNGDNLPAGILLSGGLDSRVLLGLLRDDRPEKPIHTFTWGIPGCDDAQFAAQVARVAKTQHHFYRLKPDYLIEMAEKSIRMIDGLGSCVNLHARAALDQETKYAKVIYKGFMGDALMGYSLTQKYWSQYDPQLVNKVHFQVLVDQGLIMFDLPEHRNLFTEEFQHAVEGMVFQTFGAALEEAGSEQLADQRHYFNLRQRVPRMTVQGVEMVRSRAVARLPYCDNDLVEFVLTLPPWLRSERYLMKKAFIRAFHGLARVPYTETGLPLTECAREVYLRAQRLLYWHLYRKGLKRSPHPRQQSYADYNGWFRGVLRDWVEDILLSPRTLQRGYFKPDYVRNLLSEHMAGARHAARLGALISLELWHRQFMD